MLWDLEPGVLDKCAMPLQAYKGIMKSRFYWTEMKWNIPPELFLEYAGTTNDNFGCNRDQTIFIAFELSFQERKTSKPVA